MRDSVSVDCGFNLGGRGGAGGGGSERLEGKVILKVGGIKGKGLKEGKNIAGKGGASK